MKEVSRRPVRENFKSNFILSLSDSTTLTVFIKSTKLVVNMYKLNINKCACLLTSNLLDSYQLIYEVNVN